MEKTKVTKREKRDTEREGKEDSSQRRKQGRIWWTKIKSTTRHQPQVGGWL